VYGIASSGCSHVGLPSQIRNVGTVLFAGRVVQYSSSCGVGH
jgi:hypothetical protein